MTEAKADMVQQEIRRNMKVIESILDFLLGKKYYAAVLWRTSTDIFEISSNIFRTKAEVERYKLVMADNRTYRIQAIVSFRTREILELDTIKK